MVKTKLIAIFEDQPVRRAWNQREEKWYFSVVDVVRVLTEQPNFQTARKYWNKLKIGIGIGDNRYRYRGQAPLLIDLTRL